MRNFFGELKRRHVYRVAIAYGVVAWLFIQVATQVFPFFEIPNWVVRLVVLITVLAVNRLHLGVPRTLLFVGLAAVLFHYPRKSEKESVSQ